MNLHEVSIVAALASEEGRVYCQHVQASLWCERLGLGVGYC